MIGAKLRDLVRQRAGNRCEYCRLDQSHSSLTHHIEHIVARKHGGLDEADNLALACHHCNLQKSTNLAGIDPETGELTPLYHPRRQKWVEHFAQNGARIVGLTAEGRATVAVLSFNAPREMEIRARIANKRVGQTAEVLKEIAEIDPLSARVLELTYLAGCNPGEVAEIMGLREGQVNYRLRKGVELLRGALGK